MKQTILDNLWFAYRIYLQKGGEENIAQFMTWLLNSDFISKEDFHFMG